MIFALNSKHPLKNAAPFPARFEESLLPLNSNKRLMKMVSCLRPAEAQPIKDEGTVASVAKFVNQVFLFRLRLKIHAFEFLEIDYFYY